MNNVVVAGLGATILLFGITYEYMKVKKGHTRGDNEGLIIVAGLGATILLFSITKEYLRLKGHTTVHSWH